LKNEYRFYFAYSPRWPGFRNMETDRYLGEVSPPPLPLLRLYTWDKPTISYGCNQNPARRLRQELCARDDIPVVKRPTGGRELLHGDDICYTLAWPFENALTAVQAKRVFADINDSLVESLRGMGITAGWNEFKNRPRLQDGPCFAQIDSGEVTVGGRKLVASAQRIFPRCVIQQGSIPLRQPRVDLLAYLNHGDRTSLARAMEISTAFLDGCLGREILPEELIDPFKQAFGRLFKGDAGPGNPLIEEILGNI
jgi:lipoate-protein ligase A